MIAVIRVAKKACPILGIALALLLSGFGGSHALAKVFT